MNKKHFTAIVLSAGKGNRMHSDIPKQYMDMLGYPVIYYALKAFEESRVDDVILVTGAEDVAFCTENIVQKYHLTKVKDVVPGGAERYLSVLEGLKKAQNADYVLIHDGARPLISSVLINANISCVQEKEACITAVPAKDTIKVVDNKGYVADTLERSKLWQIQTPQVFEAGLIKEAYERLYNDTTAGNITDDAMVVEHYMDRTVKMTMADYKNIKVTTPEDMDIARMFLKA